ncbi:hypothetical protein EV196_109190 [Mariniflexile fucanivorans]|uniref:Lipocalin-like protein n=1 Tax=Mariniflexile fucanivorans TaxID=264023 RepID=A0A4R1RCK1_9FLAO|nr:hypothetical protein [Mariniflexile fucanivorans]TCL63564.1 hypothetical protein EV196_109190 [Mariniflexile fucanivorans]
MKTLLKNYKLIIVLLLMVSLPSCSNDDDPELTVSELLSNKWFAETIEDVSTTPSTIEILDSCTQKSYYNFLIDGTLLTNIYTLDGDNNCVASGTDAYNYILSADGKQIVAQDEDSIATQILVIDAISTTNLTIYNTSTPNSKINFKR